MGGSGIGKNLNFNTPMSPATHSQVDRQRLTNSDAIHLVTDEDFAKRNQGITAETIAEESNEIG